MDMMPHYGLLTVRLQNPPASDEEAFQQIKKAFQLSYPAIDDVLGAFHNNAPGLIEMKSSNEEYYIVGIEINTLRQLLSDGHPNVVGWMHAMAYASGNSPLHLKKNPPGGQKNIPPQYKKPQGPGF
jgi:hypothetical protein